MVSNLLPQIFDKLLEVLSLSIELPLLVLVSTIPEFNYFMGTTTKQREAGSIAPAGCSAGRHDGSSVSSMLIPSARSQVGSDD